MDDEVWTGSPSEEQGDSRAQVTGETIADAPAHLRQLTDPRMMRALAHPVRLALLEALTVEGPLTATEAGDLIGESPTTCSFHLRQLAKYGFVEEAGRGHGRRRPWRLTRSGLTFSNVQDNPEAALAADALDRLLRERYFTHLQTWYETRRGYPQAWQEAAGMSEFLLWVTPDELRVQRAQLTALLDRYRGRLEDPTQRPAGALPVEVLAFAYPIRSAVPRSE